MLWNPPTVFHCLYLWNENLGQLVRRCGSMRPDRNRTGASVQLQTTSQVGTVVLYCTILHSTVSYIPNSILRLSNRLKRYLYGKHYYALGTTNTTIILWYTIYRCLYTYFQRSDISNWIIQLLYVRYCIWSLITYEISQKIRENRQDFFHVAVREGDPAVLLCLESNQSLVVWLHKGNNQLSEVKTVLSQPPCFRVN
jgi:hypothetical protein